MRAMGASRATITPGARPAVCTKHFKTAYSDIATQWRRDDQLPVVYHNSYNITFGGLEKLHPFDSCKFKKVGTSI